MRGNVLAQAKELKLNVVKEKKHLKMDNLNDILKSGNQE